MKHTIFYAVAAAALLLSACSDSDIVKNGKRPVVGSPISFTANTKEFEPQEKTAKTAYGDEYTQGGNSYLKINWVDGDTVFIRCAEAETDNQWGFYKVNPVTATSSLDGKEDQTTATFSQAVAASTSDTYNYGGINWGDVDNCDHEFRAIYPGGLRYLKEKSDASGNAVTQGSNVRYVTLSVPAMQSHAGWEKSSDGNTQYIKPDMKFAIMYGTGKWAKGSTSNKINIAFKPITTVLDVTITAPSAAKDYNVVSVQIKNNATDKAAITGNVKIDMNDGTFTTVGDGTDNSVATVSCLHTESGSTLPKPVTIKKGQKLNVKFFALLNESISASNFTLRVMLDNGRVYYKELADTNITPGHIVKINAPTLTALSVNSSNWMSLIDDNVYFLSQLSIPGTKHSFSYHADGDKNITDFSTTVMGRFQKLNLKEQFQAGIRAFDTKLYYDSSNNEMYINTTTGVFKDFNLKQFLSLLNSEMSYVPSEGCVVKIDYDGNTDDTSINTWLNNFNSAVGNLSGVIDNLVKLTSTTTMADMRYKKDWKTSGSSVTGGLALIVCCLKPTSLTATLNSKVLYLFDYPSERPCMTNFKISSNDNDIQVYGQKLDQVNNPEINVTDTNTGATSDATYGLLPYYIINNLGQAVSGGFEGETFPSSYNLIGHKKTLVQNVLLEAKAQQALARTGRTDMLYINDCGGYRVVNNKESLGYSGHTYGTTGGNTATFAEDMNPLLAEILYAEIPTNNYSVPLGLMYFNFAGSDTYPKFGNGSINDKVFNVEGDLLPMLIINNNFKYPLKKKTST